MADRKFYKIALCLVFILVLDLLANAKVTKIEFDPENTDPVLVKGFEHHEDDLVGSQSKNSLYGSVDDGNLLKRKDEMKEREVRPGEGKHVLHKKKVRRSPLDQEILRSHERFEGAPPDTVGKPTKIEFDNSTTDADNPFDIVFNITDGGQKFLDGSLEDEEYSQFVVLTRSGYEYYGSPAVVRSIFSALRVGRSFEELKDQVNKEFWSSSNLTSKELSDQLPKTVFPPDTRAKVSNTQKYPYSAIGKVDSGCTGTFIGPRHVITAGHCVYNTFFKKWRKNVNIQRAKNCDPDKGTYHKWKYVIITTGWRWFGWPSYDYAMIVVDEPSPVWMEIGWKKPMPLYTVNINGYPGDKSGVCMWHSNCKIMWQSKQRLGYRCDTSPGMSGSSVYAELGAQEVIYCVHAYGGSLNKCTRITESRFGQLKYWIDNY